LIKIERRRLEMADTVRRYVDGPLLRLLGATGPVTAFGPVPAGRQSIAYFVDIEGQPRGVFRAERSWLHGMTLLSNMWHLRARGVPCPALLATDRSPVTFLRWGFLPIFEERIEGVYPHRVKDAAAGIRSMAEALAELHNVCRDRWGSPRLPRWGSFRRHTLRRVADWVRQVAPLLDGAERERLLPWFLARAGDCPLDPPFSLVHAAVRLTNFVVTPEGRTVLIDLARLRYGSFARNVAWALEKIRQEDPGLVEPFRDAYFAASPPERREAFERSERFFAAAYELSRAATYSRRIRHADRSSRPREKVMGSLERHLVRLVSCLRNTCEENRV